MEYKLPKIYFLPNVMTGFNLICGFSATLSIMHGASLRDSILEKVFFGWAVVFVIAAGVFDVLDGLLARFCGQESTFGREFDSLADLVSFGVAPALLVYRIVLKDLSLAGLVLAAVYLLCCALRLARFNCTVAANVRTRTDTRKAFGGFPVPSAAGLIASLTWLSLSRTSGGYQVFSWLLPPLTLFLSMMMLSRFSYPSIGALDLRAVHPTFRLIAIGLVLFAVGFDYQAVPAVLFSCYLLYGILRPCLSLKLGAEVLQRAPIDSDELHGGGT
jgi:CDP-diacylglycerol---serine O-phosphatidyltransferase